MNWWIIYIFLLIFRIEETFPDLDKLPSVLICIYWKYFTMSEIPALVLFYKSKMQKVLRYNLELFVNDLFKTWKATIIIEIKALSRFKWRVES